MGWLCAEIRDEPTLQMLAEQIQAQTESARREGRLHEGAVVYVAPYKKWHRVFFNRAALHMLPILDQLANEPCGPPGRTARRLEFA